MNSSATRTQLALVRCGGLVVTSIALWGVLAWPAWSLAGSDGLEGLSIAAALCVVPGLLVIVIGARLQPGTQAAALLSLAGGVLRMVVVLVGVLAVQAVRPHLGFREFLVWVAAYYLVLLVAETVVAVRWPGGSMGAGSETRN